MVVVSRLKGPGVTVVMAAAAFAGEGDGAQEKGAGFIQVKEGHGVERGHLAAWGLRKNRTRERQRVEKKRNLTRVIYVT